MSISLGDAVVTISADTSQLSRGIDGAKVLMAGLVVAAGGGSVFWTSCPKCFSL